MRIEQLTFTRFLAAIAILLFHFAKSEVFPFDLTVINTFVQNGSSGVSYFFILSGFVMCVAYSDTKKINVKKYYLNRFARIYPLYFLATFLFILEWILVKKNINTIDVLISFLMIQSWIPGKEMILNSPAWSLGVELFFYLLFPYFFNSFLKKYNSIVITAVIIGFFIISQSLFLLVDNPNQNKLILYNPIMHLSSFFIGCLAGTYVAKNRLIIRNYDMTIVILTTVMLVFIYSNNSLFIHNGLLGIFIAPILIFLSLNNGKITSVFNSRKLVLLGEISFGFYILQFPIFIAFRNILIHFLNINNSLVFYLCTSILLIASYLSYIYYEKPINKKIKASSINN